MICSDFCLSHAAILPHAAAVSETVDKCWFLSIEYQARQLISNLETTLCTLKMQRTCRMELQFLRICLAHIAHVPQIPPSTMSSA